MNKNIIIALIVVGFIALFSVSNYNSLVSRSAQVDAQFAQVESQYQRRFDLIPNLVESVKGVMAQEQEIFTALADARSRYAGARTTGEKVEAINNYESAVSRLLVITENYPTLRSVETVNNLMTQLEGTENRIAVERMRYNEVATSYNITVRSIPSNIFASVFGFREKELFKSEEGADKAPKVNFGN